MTSALQIAYFVHGRGRGRASRSIPVARRLLADGHQVTVYGGGSDSHLLSELPQWHDRPPLEPGQSALLRLPWRVVKDLGALTRERPDLVISDGDQSALTAARLRRVRTLAVGPELVFSSCDLPASISKATLKSQRYRGAIPTHLAEHRVAVHFLPTEATRDNTWVARPDGDANATTANDGHFLAYFRDANGAKVVDWLRAQGRDVHWFGPGAKTPAGATGPFLERERFQRELRTAAGVIGSAGSQLLAECVLYGKPVLALYESSDTEQQLNANLAATANVAMSATFDRVDAELVERFAFRVDAGEFAKIALADHLRPVSEVTSEIVAEMAW
jgi:UDP-N-acetylglucosamine--N-acetylmuramyl-(pentapeptide) pyrophosphoryl-undecaprenol N-acetylglucosamine transferase